ncbi:inositol-3-phosphate synthase [Candidatus Micrarchaeota archaeon]|nr:inositol-3-phosphate synthase [Candidatus Micrarchaeota archaeon]
MGKIKVGVIGVGNCFAGLYQGIEYYKQHNAEVTGIMHREIGGYRVQDIEFVSAFDVGENKVGKTLDEAAMAEPNMVKWINLPKSETIVHPSPVMDGISKYTEEMIKPKRIELSPELEKEIMDEIKRTGTEILINYLPVGSQKATEYWANIALKTGCAFVNNMPVFIASNPEWEKKFREKGIPVIGDDIKGMIGATIVHRVLAKLTADRGSSVANTYQLNVGGNTDFKNMLERERLESKKISKTESVQSQFNERLDDKNIHIGPSDFVPFLENTKIAFMNIEGRMWADIPYKMEVKLTVDDKANSGGIVADAIRLAKVALERGERGAVIPACAYLMKHPPEQMADAVAKQELERFIKEEA